MINWCSTFYVISGPKNDVRSLYDRIKCVRNRKWLGNLVSRLGVDWLTVNCRGDWSNLRMKDGNLHFETQTAWSRCKDLDDIIRHKYPDLSVWFLSEELGCDIFVTNDATVEIFPKRIIIDTEGEGKEHYTYEEALHVLCDKLGLDPETNSWEQAMKLCKERNDLQDDAENEAHIWVHEVKIVS